jgi:hypothetical protein
VTVWIEWTRVATEHGDQLVVHDLDERLAGIEAARDFFTERAIPHPLDERFRDRHRDVGLEQSHADRADSVAYVLFGDTAAAGHALDRLREASRQLIEHSRALGMVRAVGPCPRSLACARGGPRAGQPRRGRRAAVGFLDTRFRLPPI